MYFTTEHRAKALENKKTKAEDLPLFIPPPPTLPTFILFAFQRLHLFVCFIAFFFPRRFPFCSFSLGHIQCNDDNYKIKQNNNKKKKLSVRGKQGRLANNTNRAVIVTVIPLDRVPLVFYDVHTVSVTYLQ